MIKNIFAAVLFTVAASFTQNLKAQNVNEIKEKKELLKLYSSLLDKNVDLAKEKEVNVQLAEEVKSINKKTDRKTDDFTSSDPNSTSIDAKKTAKLLKKAEAANKSLHKSNEKIIGIESDIKKIINKMEGSKYEMEIKKT